MATEVQFVHTVDYETPDAVSVGQIIETLKGTERLLIEMKPLMEGAIPGLQVERIRVSVRQISQQSPLHEAFVIGIMLSFQKDLEREVPKAVDELLGTHLSGQYDTIVTLLFCLVLFYGAEFVWKQVNKAAASVKSSSHIKQQLDGLIKEVAARIGCDESKIRSTLEERYGKSRMRALAASALRFFRLSKAQGNVPIKVGARRLPPEAIEEIPNQAMIADFEEEEPSEEFKGVEIELHAQDIDRPKQGWAGVIPLLSQKRLRMELYPPMKPEDIYTRTRIKGDVVVISKRNENGEFEPYMFHLMSLSDG